MEIWLYLSHKISNDMQIRRKIKMTKTVLTIGTTGGLGKEFGKWFTDNGNNLVIIVSC